MIINRESWIFVCGQAGSGKTLWIREHIKKIPQHKAAIFDFNRNDYQDFEKNQYLWNVESGSQKEVEDFIDIIYQEGNILTVFDEADNYFLYPSEKLRRFVNTARNRGIGAIVNAKRAKSIKPVYRNRFTHIVIFRTIMPEDIRYMEDWSGIEKGGLEYVRALKIGEHIVIDLMAGIQTKKSPLRIS